MFTDRIRWTWKLFSPCLCASVVIALLGELSTVEAGKNSASVVKTTAVAGKIDAAGNQTVTVTLAIDKDWHTYANPVNYADLDTVKTVVVINAKAKPADVKIQYPAGKLHQDQGGAKYLIYEDKISIQAVVTRAAGDTSPLDVEVRFNACHIKGVCLPSGSVNLKLP